jgi:hypothetical protein
MLHQDQTNLWKEFALFELVQSTMKEFNYQLQRVGSSYQVELLAKQCHVHFHLKYKHVCLFLKKDVMLARNLAQNYLRVPKIDIGDDTLNVKAAMVCVFPVVPGFDVEY